MLAPDAISPAFLNELAKRIVGGESLAPFSEWFVTTVYAAQRDPKDVTPIDDQARRMLLAIARQFWSHVPRPTSHWRALPLPKIERNDPCYCGSGKKYKQCCAPFSSMRVPFESDVLFALALDCIEPDALTASDWVTLPPLALAQAATFWSDRGDDERVVQVLGAYFNEHPKLDERSEPALDALFGALQDLGLEQERIALAIRLSEHKNKSLATTARCRHVVMLTDRGDFAAAWKIFEQAQRAHPTDPQLTHLEIMVLLSEGREDEAALRGKTLAAQLRRRGPDFYDFADIVERMGRDGFAGMSEAMANNEDLSELDEDVPAWLALFQRMPAAPADWAAHYTLERASAIAPDGSAPDAWLAPTKTMAALEAKWTRSFPTTSPTLTELEGDAESLLEDVLGVEAFFRANANAWHSFAILDDLLAAGYTLADENDSAKLDHACLRLALRGVANLRAVMGDQAAHLPWAVSAHRPALRMAARGIELSQRVANPAQAIELAEWMLAVNPNDNHGNRTLLVGEYLYVQRAADALAIMERYPEDLPITLFDRALCLFLLDRKAEAASFWARAAKGSPHVPSLLLSEAPLPALDDDDVYVTLGSYEEAHGYVSDRQSAWARAGALEWARALPQVKAAKKPAKKARREAAPAAAAPAGSMFATLPALTPALWSELDALFDDIVMLHGFVVGIAMSPGRGNGSEWTGTVISMINIDLNAGDTAKNFKRVNSALPIVLNLHNGIRADLFEPQHSKRTPADWLKPIDMDAPQHAARWAKGFVRAAESRAADWQRVKLPVNSASGPLAPLYAMAARAPLTGVGDAWRLQSEAQRPLFAAVSPSASDTQSDGEHLAAFISQLQVQLQPFNGAQPR